MNKFNFFSFICLFLGIILLFFGFLSGDVEAGVFVIFPFFMGSGILTFLGFELIMIAFFLYIFSFTQLKQDDDNEISDLEPDTKTKIKGGGVVLIGPIPIVFGSNPKIAIILMIIAIIVIFFTFFIFRLF
jgi:uncharacterized protein (TIGR00304 family)